MKGKLKSYTQIDLNMDYIREFDIKLEKEMFYAGEILSGFVILDTIENFKLRGKLKRLEEKRCDRKMGLRGSKFSLWMFFLILI